MSDIGRITFGPAHNPDRQAQNKPVYFGPLSGYTVHPAPNNWRVVSGQDAPALEREEPTGFFDLEAAHRCQDLAHNAPTHLHIPAGKGYRHRCPSCGFVTTIIPAQVTL